jgi:hypothetical protein
MTDANAVVARASLTLARAALVAVGALAVPVVGGAALLHGAAGAAGAGAGLGLVLMLFGAAALVQAWAARLSTRAWLRAVAGGVVARLLLYTVVLAVLARVSSLHWPSLALATAIGLAGALALELRALARRPELFWVRTSRTSEGAQR